jgi:pimeloyl-ACP methyl ester carboxylesterase
MARVEGDGSAGMSHWVSVLVAVTFQITAGSQLRLDRQVQVGAEVVRIRCDGPHRGSAPVVVLEAGAGNGADSWNEVFPTLAEFARVCAYDRPRFDEVGRDLQLGAPADIVERLRRVLTAAGERPPYILIGHSSGGLVARLYERTFRKEVAALVLVDPTPERWPQSAVASPLREDREVPLLAREVASRPCDIECPVIVLSRGRWSASPRVDDDELTERVARWTQVQQELARCSARGQHQIAYNSGHNIQLTEPHLIVAAVRRVAEKVTQRR